MHRQCLDLINQPNLLQKRTPGPPTRILVPRASKTASTVRFWAQVWNALSHRIFHTETRPSLFFERFSEISEKVSTRKAVKTGIQP